MSTVICKAVDADLQFGKQNYSAFISVPTQYIKLHLPGSAENTAIFLSLKWHIP